MPNAVTLFGGHPARIEVASNLRPIEAIFAGELHDPAANFDLFRARHKFAAPDVVAVWWKWGAVVVGPGGAPLRGRAIEAVVVQNLEHRGLGGSEFFGDLGGRKTLRFVQIAPDFAVNKAQVKSEIEGIR